MKKLLTLFLLTTLILCSCIFNRKQGEITDMKTELTDKTVEEYSILLAAPQNGANVEIANDLVLSFTKEQYSFKCCDKYFDLISDKYMPQKTDLS